MRRADRIGTEPRLAANGSHLYVGGDFSLNGSIERNHVARWDGSSWEALGTISGNLASVHAIAPSDGSLYVGGEFAAVDGIPASRVARWDGVDWHPMGDEVFGTVRSLWVEGDEVYAGGSFSGTAENTIFGVAKWNGSAWVALGKGVHKSLNFPATPTVSALLGTAEGLYLGGNFTHAGNSYSNQIALWTDFSSTVEAESPAENPTAFSLDQNYPNPFNPRTTFRLTLGSRELVNLRVYDMLGREVATLLNGVFAAGSHEVVWDAGDLPGGVYVCRLTAGSFARARKLVLIK